MAKERDLKWAKEAAEEVKEETLETEEAEENTTEEATEETAQEAEEVVEEVVEGTVEDGQDKLLSEAKERYQRLFAEFDNYRKRTDKEKSVRYDMGARDMVEKILPVLDNFELAFKNIPESEKDSPFVDGMDKIHKQFVKVLEDAGVKPIEAVGKEFDPNLHNA